MSRPLLNITGNLSNMNFENANLTRANLTGAILPGKNFTRATLTEAKLISATLTGAKFEEAYLYKAELQNATLTNANLTKAYLYNGNLTGANLTGANLTGANLTGANLTGANLTGANLTGANLTGANLTDVDLTVVTLSEIQRQQIRIVNQRSPVLRLSNENIHRLTHTSRLSNENHRSSVVPWALPREYLWGPVSGRFSNAAIRSCRPFFSAQGEHVHPSERCEIVRRNMQYSFGNNSNNNPPWAALTSLPRQFPSRDPPLQSRRINPSGLLIEVSANLLKLKKSSNSACPLYNELYDFVQKQDLSSKFKFKYKGQFVIDMGGVTRDIFEKLLPVYTHRFFESIVKNNECVILKNDINMEKLIGETNNMILLAKAAGVKIFLKIDPRLFPLLSDKEYLNNNENKKENLKVLYRAVNYYTNSENINNYNVLTKNTNSTFLRKINQNQNKNYIIRQYKETQNEELKRKLKKEIRLRKFLVEFGFTTWKQFEDMCYFFKQIIETNKQNFFFKLNFNLESFLGKFTILKVISSNGQEIRQEIPLIIFGKLSYDKTTFEFEESNTDVNEIYKEYEYLRAFLDYIIGPSSTDNRRAMCMTYATGSSYYPGSFKIKLYDREEAQSFDAHTCDVAIYFYKYHKNRTYPFDTKEEYIEYQIKSKVGNDFSLP
jgi:hypothetical protein